MVTNGFTLLCTIGMQLPLEHSCLQSLCRGVCGECQSCGLASLSLRKGEQRGLQVSDVRTCPFVSRRIYWRVAKGSRLPPCMMQAWVQCASGYVLVSRGCHNKLPWTGLVKTTEVYSLMVLERNTETQNQGVSRATLPLEALGNSLFFASSSFCGWWLSLIHGCVTPISASMVTITSSSVFSSVCLLWGHLSLDWGPIQIIQGDLLILVSLN